MRRWLQRWFWRFARRALGLRYRVRVEGAERLRGVRGPVLVMPNHPGFIDPPLVLSHLPLREPLRPMVYKPVARHPVIYPFMRMVDAFEVPDLAEHSRSSREQTLALIDEIAAGLKRGQSFLIYPAGRLQQRGREEVGATRSVAELLQRCPEATVVLVRTRGLWGSTFSRAWTGSRPLLGRCILRGIGVILANLVFFTPRRRVTMTVEVPDRQNLPEPTREQLNPWLEDWYNREGPEEPKFVPYHFAFGAREHEFPELEAGEAVDPSQLDPATIDAVNEMLEEHLGRPLEDEEKQPGTTLDRVGLDSLDRMDLALKIEQRFGFGSDQVAETVGQLWLLAEGKLKGAGGAAEVPAAWKRPPSSSEPVRIVGDTLGEAFVRRCLEHPGDVAVADGISGALSYRKLLVGARLLGKRFAGFEQQAVGVMFPASVAADLVFFGLHFAGKLPVMLNWTTGPANLAHAVKTLGIRRVVTSHKLVDRLGIEVEGADYVFLEELRGEIGRLERIATFLATYAAPKHFLRALPPQEPGDTAVVLFTSGSEAAPKAVPLTHRNLIVMMRSGAKALEFTRASVLLGSLPPFHSFGLAGNVVMPIITGIRMVHYPDPTDAAGMVRITAQYRPTLIYITPSFLDYMLRAAGEGDLDSLRLISTGAEKCPERIFDKCAEVVPGAEVLEGYGITECSPVVSANRPGRAKRGSIGLPLDVVDVRVVDPDTNRPLEPGQTGMLLVHGPTIFDGYLHYDGPDPFVELDGKRWYRTGDLVRIDDEGYIFFQGRLKRFLKAGGEMISLPALEEPISRRYPPTDDGPQVAVEGIETPEGRRIALFTTTEVSLREANAILAEAGFRGVMRLDEVRRLDDIPVLGTGKTDYKVLRRMLAEERGKSGNTGRT